MDINEVIEQLPKLPGNVTNKKSPGVVNNHFEALKVLTNSLLHEIEALQVKEIPAEKSKINLLEEVQRFETDLIRSALVRTSGRQRAAARLLNVKITTLNAKIKRYGIEANSRT